MAAKHVGNMTENMLSYGPCKGYWIFSSDESFPVPSLIWSNLTL